MTRIEELKAIAKNDGGVLRPERVVDFARDPTTALHAAFTWDDSEAAEAWRLHQARNIIRVSVQVVERAGKPLTVPVFVSLQADRNAGGGYRETYAVMGDKDTRAALLAEARRDMEAFEERFAMFEELAEVLAAMRKARKRI